MRAHAAALQVFGTLWLTDDDDDASNLNAANYGDRLLIAWTTGATWNSDGTNHFALLNDPSGAIATGPEEISQASLSSSSDFFLYTDGDVGWAQRSDDGEVSLARLGVCP